MRALAAALFREQPAAEEHVLAIKGKINVVAVAPELETN
jgi:hypothetical protein